MNMFGNLSYPVYLTHPMVALFVGPSVYFEFAGHGLATQAYLVPMIVVFLILSIMVGALAHYLLEKPISAIMKATLSRSEYVFRRSSA